MARPIKKGIDYFPMDCHINDKLKLIQAEYGLKGFAIVVKLYQKIYGEFGYYCEWDKDRSLLFAQEYCSSSDDYNLIDSVVRSCISRGIFSKEIYEKHGVLTSAGIQQRYLEAKRKSKELKSEYRLVGVVKNTVNEEKTRVIAEKTHVYVCENPIKKSKEKKSKENKNKENKNKENKKPVYYSNEELNDLFIDFLKSRAEAGDEVIGIRLKQLIDKLDFVADNDSERIEIVKNTIANGWKSFYPLKKESGRPKNAKKFDERKYSQEEMAEIEKRNMEKAMEQVRRWKKGEAKQ